jgi:hypothetical protein
VLADFANELRTTSRAIAVPHSICPSSGVPEIPTVAGASDPISYRNPINYDKATKHMPLILYRDITVSDNCRWSIIPAGSFDLQNFDIQRTM